MKKFLIIGLLLAVAGTAVFAGGQKEAEGWSGNYEFGGSTTVEPIMVAASEIWEERYTGLNLSYDSQGSSVGVRGALDGTYDLGAASRALKDSEIDEGAVAYAVSLDGVAVIVNKNTVNIDNLGIDEVTKIYAGEITNWSDLGGPNEGIVVFNRDEASGTRSCFKDATVKPVKADFTDTAAIVTSNGDMVSKVGSTPYAIGYCGFGYIGRDPGTKTLTVDGVEPKANNVLDDSYKVSRKLIVVSNGEVEDGSFEKAFIDYLLSDEGQAIVLEEGFIPLQ
ncbi:MAG: phosphate ABC transporter substrate-binding protein [Spirochaetia bacterium]